MLKVLLECGRGPSSELRRPHGPLPAPSPSLADALESKKLVACFKRILLAVCFLLLLPLNSFAADDFFFKANELYDQGRYKESVKYYRAAIDDGSYEPFAWFNLGNEIV